MFRWPVTKQLLRVVLRGEFSHAQSGRPSSAASLSFEGSNRGTELDSWILGVFSVSEDLPFHAIPQTCLLMRSRLH